MLKTSLNVGKRYLFRTEFLNRIKFNLWQLAVVPAASKRI